MEKLQEPNSVDRRLELVTIVICTRNRGALLAATIHSVMNGTRPPDELLVVDQSDTDDTRHAVEAAAAVYPAVRYVATETRGLSRARNVGLEHSRDGVIAFTDDDVLVCPDWLERVAAEFTAYPRLAMLFGTVLPPDTYDWTQEFIPHAQVPTRRPVPWWSRDAVCGIGANMALRRSVYARLGGFDPMLGPGAPAFAGDDYEYALRCVCHEPPLLLHLLDEARVIHHAGARRGEEYHRFVHQMNGTGMGLFWAYLMTGKRGFRFKLKAVHGLIVPLGEPLRQLACGKKPSGLRTYAYSLKGFAQGCKKRPHAEQ